MIWIEYLVMFLSAFVISLLISRRLPGLFDRMGILDKKSLPERKPTSGGVAVALSFLVIIGVSCFGGSESISDNGGTLSGLFFASVVIFLLGIYDDIVGVSAWQKITVQIVAGGILIAGGIRMEVVTNPFSSPWEVGIWGNLILIFWIIVITNSINLIDGIDGLASGICLISSITLFSIAHMFSEYTLAVLAVILAGALFGFIRYNLPPARIYLGDAGSLFLGFVLAAISITERRKGIVTVTLLVPVLLLAIPLLDTVLAFFRRLVSGRNPMEGDKEHIHHRLIKLGFTPEQVNLMLYLFSIYFGITAGILSFFPKETAMVVLVLLAIGFLMGLEFLRAIERERGAKR